MKYTVVAETGARNEKTNSYEGIGCGHLHRTYAAAEKCQDKLRNHGQSAKWYNSRIHNENGERVSERD